MIKNKASSVAAAVAVALLSAQVHAASAQAFDVPAGDLIGALEQFAQQSGARFLYSVSDVKGLTTTGVHGELTPEEAIGKLLQGTGLRLTVHESGAMMIAPEHPSKVSSVAAPFRLAQSAAAEGSAGSKSENGSEAEQAKAGDQEVTVVGTYIAPVTIGKATESLRNIPQSVSVMTRQRMEDQNLQTLTEALKQVTGITIAPQGGNDSLGDISARGYEATSMQIDGVNVSHSGVIPYLDLAVFERIEVHRGAEGLFKGAGDPGLSYNLVRKRAQAPMKLQATVSAGSWDAYRAEVDLTGALTDSGRLRGRTVLALTDSDSYLDNMNNNKKLGYGTLEFDLLDRTTLSAGIIWQKIDGGMSYGLPSFLDGRLPNVPRSTNLAADFMGLQSRTVDGFAEAEHRLLNGGTFKAVVRHHKRETAYSAYTTGGLADDGTILNFQNSRSGQSWGPGTADARPDRDTGVDVFLSTPFELAGRTHNVLVGADYAKSDSMAVSYRREIPGTYNIFGLDPEAIAEPSVESPLRQNVVRNFPTESYGFYSQLRVKPFDSLTLVAAGRFSWHDTKNINHITGVISHPEPTKAEFTPYTGLIFDLNRQLSLYAIYSESFDPQTSIRVSGEQLPPRVGEQYEAGIKGEFRDGRLNASLSAYRIEDVNRALEDLRNPDFAIPAGLVRNQGFDAEISGQLLPRLNVTAGYAFTTTKYVKGADYETGLAFSPNTPKHNFNLWGVYRLPDSWVAGMEVGGGIRAVSDFYYEDSRGRWVGDGYVVASMMTSYRINERYKLGLNVENIFNRKYWARVASPAWYNQYGSPRSATLTLRATF